MNDDDGRLARLERVNVTLRNALEEIHRKAEQYGPVYYLSADAIEGACRRSVGLESGAVVISDAAPFDIFIGRIESDRDTLLAIARECTGRSFLLTARGVAQPVDGDRDRWVCELALLAERRLMTIVEGE